MGWFSSNRRRSRDQNGWDRKAIGCFRRSLFLSKIGVVVLLGEIWNSGLLLNWVSNNQTRELFTALCLYCCGLESLFLSGVVRLEPCIGDFLVRALILANSPYTKCHFGIPDFGSFSKAFTWTIFLWRLGARSNFQTLIFGNKYVYYCSVQPILIITFKSRIILAIGKFKKLWSIAEKSHFCGWVYRKSVNFLLVLMHLALNSEFWIRAIRTT